MSITDKVVSWYVKNYLMTKAQILNKPGFIVFNVSGKTPIFARQVIIPELFFILLEKSINEKFGVKGNELLYSTGKQFGFRFAQIGGFIRRDEVPTKNFLDYVKVVSKFIEGTYAKEISHGVDLNLSTITYTLRNFIVCSKVGYGFFLPLGAGAGLVSYLMNNPKMEGVHLECQGRGDACCKLVYASPEYLHKLDTDQQIFVKTDLKKTLDPLKYAQLNAIKKIEHSSYSFNDFLNSKVFSFNEGIILHNEQRYFIFETGGVYLINKALGKDESHAKILFDCAFETGKKLAENSSFVASLKSVMDLFAAFGWGDLFILEKNNKFLVSISHYPWTEFYEEVKFIIERGLLSGVLTIFAKRPVILKNFDSSFSQKGLELVFSES